ncbi:DciA family protein [Altericista sp. CCNU0014]|uniref:DciA family protein n=1 Tax=Altericista sp. CCNU0014 TaxID=3082949 RepID=UPI003850CAAD
MPLEGLNAVLSQLKQTHWRDQQSFDAFVRLWPEIVGAAVAAQTRPVKLSTQGILHVAVSGGAWAQNLAFERVRILKKVNATWHGSVKDIYFSTRDWHRSPSPQHRYALDLKLVSAESASGKPKARSQPADARDAFSRWSVAVQKRTKGNDRCPICQCPTPLEELRRWNHCALCLSRAPSDSRLRP